MIKSTILLTFLSLLSILFNLIIQIILAYYFGTGFERDAFILASTTPTYITTICVGSIGVTLIPLLVEINKSDKISINSILLLISIISIVLGLLIYNFSEKIIYALLQNKNIDNLSIEILKILSPTIFFLNFNSILTSIYHSKKKFLIPGISTLVIAITSLIFVIILNYRFGIKSLAYGQVAGSIFAFLLMLPILKGYKLKFSLKDSNLILFLHNIFPLIITGLLFKSYSVFERSFASNMEKGSISYLAYSSQIWAIAASISINSIVITTFPRISSLYFENQLSKLSEYFNQIVKIILLLALPIIFIFYFFGTTIIQIVFERGVFKHSSTIFVYKAIVFSSLYFISQCLGAFLSRMFNISKNNKFLFYISAIEFVAYILIASFKLFNNTYIGLSIALSVSSFVNILLSLYFINIKIVPFNWRALIFESTKITFISFISVFVVKHFFSPHIHFSEFTNLTISIVLIFVIGIFLSILLKLNEVSVIKKIIIK